VSSHPENNAGHQVVQYLHSVVDAVGAELRPEESIIQIRRGRTTYGKQTYVYFLVDIATLAQNTGNEPTNRRTRIAEINVDSPHSPKLHDALWAPYDHSYN
jgi:hypothetical protein